VLDTPLFEVLTVVIVLPSFDDLYIRIATLLHQEADQFDKEFLMLPELPEGSSVYLGELLLVG
jgi:hypothetical protein